MNPAITLSIALNIGNYSQLLVYSSAQLLGAMSGLALPPFAARAAERR
jgi:glycerol uptake facilitator-like aquaporin